MGTPFVGGQVAKGHDNPLAMPAATSGEGLVDDDPRQPGRQLRVRAELSRVAIGGKVGLLQNVFCVRLVFENCASDAIEGAIIAPHHRFKSGLVVARNAAHELGVVDRRICRAR